LRQVEKLVARQKPAGTVEKHLQKIGLGAGEVDGHALSVHHLAGGRLHPVTGKARCGAGRRRQVAKARRDQYFIAYRSSVLTALEDVENALVRLSEIVDVKTGPRLASKPAS
jgi:hypothetical protein